MVSALDSVDTAASTMQAPSSSDGIQRLLAAEQEAQAIIAKARKGDAIRVASASCCFANPGITPTHTAKSERLKQAKAEAEKELAVFKAEREEQYKKRVAEVRVAVTRVARTPTLLVHRIAPVARAT